MSLKSNQFNGLLPKVFNPKNFIVTNLLDDIISNTITSQQVQAPVIQRVSAETGETDDFITQSELDVELDDLKSLLLGSDALSNSLNSIAEINSAINSDPQFYTHITSSISTKANQSDLNATNGNVSALDTRLDSAETTIGSHTTTLTSHTASLASHTTTLGSHTSSISTINSNVSNLQSKTNAMSYSGNTLTMNENVIVTLDESLNGNVTIGNASTDILTVNSATTFNGTVSGLTKSMVSLGNVDNTSDTNKPVSTAQQTALNLKANLASPTFTGTVSGITKSMVSLGNCDNTSDANKPISTAQQTALDLKANQTSLDTTNSNVTALQSKTNSMTFNAGTNTLTMNENVIVNLDEFLNGNVTIGNASTDNLVVNSATTFVGTVSGLTKSMVSLGNCDNTSDVNKPVSTAQQTALNLKANLASPTFTGTVIAPTYSANDNSTKVATTAYCDSAISTLIGGAPSSLNSLNELALALSNDSNYSTTITTALATKGSLSNDNTWVGDQIYSSDITFDSQDLKSRLDTDETNIASNSTNITSLQNLKANLASPAFTGTVSGITKSMVSLGNCDNTSDVNKPVSTAQQTALDLKANLASPTFTGTISGITKSMVGLGNCDNTSDVNKPVSTAQQTALNLKANQTSLDTTNTNVTALQTLTNKMAYNGTTNTLTMNENVIVNLDEFLNGNVTIGNAGTDTLTVNSATTFVGTVSGLTKTMVSLGNCDNTSDVNKPVSTAQQTALNLKANLASPTFTGTVSGITKSMVSLGNCDNTSDASKPVSTAQQTALDLKANLASPTFTGTVSGITKSMVSLGNCDNTSDASKPVSTAQQTALDLKANLASPTFTGTVSGITKSMVSLGNCDNTSDASKPVSTAQQTALDLKANLASPTFTGTVSGITKSMVSLGNCDNTSDASKPVSTAQQTALDLKATDSLTCHLAGTESITGAKTFNLINENINYVSGVTTSLSLDYTTCKGINLIATPSANYSLAISNVPSGSTNATYTVTLITTAKYYVNSITVNGTSRTIYANGGTANISINASSVYSMQQLNICFLNSSTPVVFSSVMSIF
jgi:hypothetical protein